MSAATTIHPKKRLPIQKQTMPSLLLVEADAAARRRMASLLNKMSPDIFVAKAGTVATAIKQIDKYQPGTILLDIALPDGNGLEVLRHAMALDERCMVIILTDRATAASRLRCFEEGADFVFTKSAAFERALDTAHRASKRELTRAARRPSPQRVHSAELRLANKSGLHVLPAARLVRQAQRFIASIRITYNGRVADAKSIMDVIALGAECGAEIVLTAEGHDAAKGIAAIRSLAVRHFHEDPAGAKSKAKTKASATSAEPSAKK